MIKTSIDTIRKNIGTACKKSGRDMREITVLAATKNRSVKEINEVMESDITVIGENRVQELLEKIPYLPKNVRIDFIGHLQKNKVNKIIGICELIHSVDSLELAEKINQEAAKIPKIQKILLEINISGEKTKFGFSKEQVIEIFAKLLKLNNINIQGLMTMAPHVTDQNKLRSIFRDLRLLRDELEQKFNIKLPELSMGMSNDYEIAIEEGATIIRLARIIFDN